MLDNDYVHRLPESLPGEHLEFTVSNLEAHSKLLRSKVIFSKKSYPSSLFRQNDFVPQDSRQERPSVTNKNIRTTALVSKPRQDYFPCVASVSARIRIPTKNTGPLEGIWAVINNDSVLQLTKPLQSGPFESRVPTSEVHSKLLRSEAIFSKKS